MASGEARLLSQNDRPEVQPRRSQHRRGENAGPPRKHHRSRPVSERQRARKLRRDEDADQRRHVTSRRGVQPPVGKRNHRRDSIHEKIRPEIRRGERWIKIEPPERQQSLRQKVPAERRVTAHQGRDRTVHEQHHAHEAAGQNERHILHGPCAGGVLLWWRRISSLQPRRNGAHCNQSRQHGPQCDGDVKHCQPEDAVKQNQQGEGKRRCPPRLMP